MKKIFKGLMCLGLCGALAMGLSGCKKSEHRDPENDEFKLAIGAVDGKFNPLFYTSLNDGEIANLTQVAMVTTDTNGNFSYGDDYPTVTLDYKETYRDAAGEVVATGNGIDVVNKPGKEIPKDGSGTTTYEFVIKNGMTFSDGKHKLTVMDVLFNLYVYLDPVYSGSSTIYSTKIEGLQKYRTQNPFADDSNTGGTSFNDYYSDALTRQAELINWAEDKTPEQIATPPADTPEEIVDGLNKIKEYYPEEVESDWNATYTGWKETYKEYRFTEAWQAFYFAEGVVQTQKEMTENGATKDILDENGKKYTEFDPYVSGAYQGDIGAQHLIDAMAAATTEDKINAYMSSHEGYTKEDALLALQKEHATSDVVNSRLSSSVGLEFILSYTATSSRVMEYFMQAAMSADRGEGELEVKNISGITVDKINSFEDGNGETKNYSESHDKLSIKIMGVDPKAKWNFGFTVAPMYYYSDGVNQDGSENQNSEYYKAAMASYERGDVYDPLKSKDFGVRYRDIDWMTDVVTADWKNKVPMGAGAYQCCTNKRSTSGVTGINFFYNNVAYYARNDYFDTMGANIENAKIKYVTYRVTSDDLIVSSLKTGEIDYGTPTATSHNQKEVQTGNLKQVSYLTGGYGYVGINPKYVPDIEVRRAIMHAFNTNQIKQYYGEGLVNLIDRPMSTTSWAYPKNVTRYYERWIEQQQIIDLVKESGNWTFNQDDQKFYNANNEPLKITFTIAGETTDHPAYKMFLEAETFLETCGFEISVETNVQALQKLATGDLQVWAAAWSSSIDPDPYQIYSINSNASSTKNWYKDGIIRDEDTFAYENEKAHQISDLIDQGRATLQQNDRAQIYAQCLDLIMDLAVEFPTYQRRDLCVYNSAALDEKSMHINDASFNMGPISELWKVAYKK